MSVVAACFCLLRNLVRWNQLRLMLWGLMLFEAWIANFQSDETDGQQTVLH